MFRGVGFALAAAALSLGAAPAGAGDEGEAVGGDAIPQRMRGAGAVSSPSHAAPNPVCELGWAERSRTPSRACIACHDGTASPAPVELFSMGLPGSSMSHPVDVDYSAAYGRDPEHYLPPGALPPDVPLVDGKVTCTSCHDGASPDPKRVTNPIGLCQSCHQL